MAFDMGFFADFIMVAEAAEFGHEIQGVCDIIV
jgi:hypothetical protein